MENLDETTAKTLSRNRIKKISDRKLIVSNRSSKANFFDGFEISEKFLGRGWYDIASLNLRYIDISIYDRHCPSLEEKKKIFKVITATRCLSFGFTHFEGCKKNINLILSDFKQSFFNDDDKRLHILFDFFLDIFQTKVVKIKKISKIFPKIQTKHLNSLIKKINQEEAFYIYTNKIISSIYSESKKSFDNEHEDKEEQSNLAPQNKKSEENKKISFKQIDEKKEKFKPDNGKANCNAEPKTQNNIEYKVYTKKFDIFTKAERLISHAELKKLRQKFDEECKDNTKLVNSLAKKLEKLLYSLDYSTWKFDQDEGFFDSSRFSQFIANPKTYNIFKLKNENTEKNTVVSLLLDNSGSMRGKPIVTSAMTAEIITKTLEKCRVNVEILGFTTKEWKGGKSKKLWDNNRVVNPGRLNDLLHIVYKDADTPWNQTKLNLGLVLKDGILKENIDGEALIWASNRLGKRTEKKKILIVISDGAPVDDATLSCNNSNILDNHLKETVADIEKKKKIDLIAIGIGHDVSKYYNNAFTIDDVEKLGEIIIDNLTEIIKDKR